MELLPVLDPLDTPKEGIWYSLIPRGRAPGVSVGHTCTFYSSGNREKGKILIVGGANPSGSFSNTFIINLDTHEWDIPEWEGLDARYEHCSFVPERCPHSLWLFGGAHQSGNLQCIQKIQLNENKPSWQTVSVNGKIPSARTYHTNSACVGDRLFVFSGGEAGTMPVLDSQLNVFDTGSLTWSQPETRGTPPPARHGHIVVAVGSRIFIHGGMAGEKFFSDLFALDTGTMSWEQIHTKGDIPPAVAAHAAVALDRHIYVFGGMTAGGASNFMYRFNTDNDYWTKMKFEGDLPPNRLDHSMCLVPWKVSEKTEDGQQDTKTKHLAFVFGGMDTQGVIHNDCIVTVLT
ncbi:rab9 effector protein with kelch motifs isoform X1 [Periophthalmus magnuspinnatus]|uniref:rab9 effector protein with kelch motifs isoform X1 n=1 Tax=Periophthalmus magnuspinnatus TaxID=409849 RepID=UPI00145B223A|nr:rab9 effector protein with kelch motifs isoform X1 [Periophthalmus magnuspinnatus]